MVKIDFNEQIAKEITGDKRAGNIKTENGLDVKILKFDAKGEKPIVGLVGNEFEELAMQWTAEGKRNPKRLNTPSVFDLYIEVEH